MKFKIIILALSILFLCGCGNIANEWSHMKSSTVGIKRIVTLYSQDGKVVKSWEIDSVVENPGGSFRFLFNGKAVMISGTVIIEEK